MQLPAQQPARPGQPDPVIRRNADQLMAAINEIGMERATAYRDDSPLPVVGTTPPVPQPGQPPMSQWATDVSRILIATGVASVPPGLIAIGLLVASEHADPTVIGMICAAPAALAIPILAVARLARRAKEVIEAAPATVHQHYHGPVTQDSRSTSSNTRGVWAKTTNRQERA